MKTTLLILLAAAAVGGFGFGLAQTPTPITLSGDVGHLLHLPKTPSAMWVVWVEDGQLKTFKLPKGTTINTP